MLNYTILEKDHNITKDMMEASEITLDDLNYIANDFANNKSHKYNSIMEDFIRNYLTPDKLKAAHIHSFRNRIKDPEHLAAKIVRRKKDNYQKYRCLNKDNYECFVMDLIGIRCFILFREDWVYVHNYLMSFVDDNAELYVKDFIQEFEKYPDEVFLAEGVKSHIRNGDDRSIYEPLLPPQCVIDDKIYRSVHYVISYKGVYLEIQVRTLFDESWGEIDHDIRYPCYKNDPLLKEYSGILNRISGLGDETSSLFKKTQQLELELSDLKNKLSNQESTSNSLQTESSGGIVKKNPLEEYTIQESPPDHSLKNDFSKETTPKDCLDRIFEE